jgi:hypothetical protein
VNFRFGVNEDVATLVHNMVVREVRSLRRTVEAQQRKIEAQELAIAQLQATQLEATTRLEALEGASGNASTSEDEYSEC